MTASHALTAGGLVVVLELTGTRIAELEAVVAELEGALRLAVERIAEQSASMAGSEQGHSDNNSTPLLT